MNIQTTQKMSSLQVSEMVGKRHDSVKRTIELLITKAVIVQPQFVTEQLADALGRPRTTQVYIFSGEQGKRDSIIVVAQLSPEFTGALVDRWQELEAQASQPVIALPHDYISALEELLITKKSEQVALEQLAITAPKAAALDTLSHAKGSLGIREAAKAVDIPEREFIARCLDKNKPISSRFMYRDNDGRLNAHAHRIKQKFMSQKITTYKGKNGFDFTTIKVKFTAAGLAHIAKHMQIKD